MAFLDPHQNYVMKKGTEGYAFWPISLGVTTDSGLGVDGFDDREQVCPGNNDFHHIQKFLAPGLLGFLDEIGGSKAELFHGGVRVK